MKKILQIIAVFMMVFSFSSCKSQELSSTYISSERIVDGYVNDWNDNEMTFLEKQDVMVGVVNDDENLYISFYTTSPERAKQLMQAGFTVWLDANGKKKTFGIHYPIRNIEGMDMPKFPGKNKSQLPQEKGGQDFMEKVDKNLVIIDGKEEKEYKKEYLDDVQVAYSFDREMFMYELRIPLKAQNHKYYVEPTKKNVIYACIETDEMQKPQRPSGPGGFHEGMGERPEGEQRKGNPGGMMKGNMPNMPSKIELWMKIQLANQ